MTRSFARQVSQAAAAAASSAVGGDMRHHLGQHNGGSTSGMPGHHTNQQMSQQDTLPPDLGKSTLSLRRLLLLSLSLLSSFVRSKKQGREHWNDFISKKFITVHRGSVAIARATIGTSLEASRWSSGLEFHSPARGQPAEQSATMKIQLLLRRVDPLDVGSDGPAANRTTESATPSRGRASVGAQRATTAAARLVRHRSSPPSSTAAAAAATASTSASASTSATTTSPTAAAAAAAASSWRSWRQEEGRRYDR